LALALAVALVRPALAHERVEVGPYVLIIGWLNEPVVVGERTAILIEVTLDGEPVEGVEAALDVEILYGGRTRIGNLSPAAEPGVYTAELIPTVAGQYDVRLYGAIGDERLDMLVQPEEVLSAGALQFPEAVTDARDVELRLEELEAQLTTANALAAVGIGLGAVAIAISIVVLRRKNTP
jgi:hypothetical protein